MSTRAHGAEVIGANMLHTDTHDLRTNLGAIVRHVLRHADSEEAAASALGLDLRELRRQKKALGIAGGRR